MARASSVCEPSASAGVTVCGVGQEAQPPPSRRHSYVAGDWLEPKPKVGVVLELGSAGVSGMVVSGAVVSTVQVCVAGVGSAFPAASTARTLNVCEPSARPA